MSKNWVDINGNIHILPDGVLLKDAIPVCKYLLPCGICCMSSKLEKCSLLKEYKSYENND